MADLREQLREAWQSSGKSLPELVQAAGLDCTADSLSRKLSGNQSLRLDEACALVKALGKQLTITRRKRAA